MHSKNNQLTQLAILIALSIVLGKFVSIPTPTGFLTLLDAGIYFTAFLLGPNQGMVVGGVSAFLIDLLSGYPNWMIFSLFAHGGQGYFAGLKGKKRPFGLALASLVMILIYFITSGFMYGFGAAIAGLLGNTFQNFFGMLVGYSLFKAYQKYRGNK
ncbi:hypothetical protein HMPREF9318_01938 [Streptococcus urinalis FB127-CNA-2]|uniref:Thiamine transporter HmpT n=1 Tax=Streptococcus urinalis 2285-97 TaxID=764291 RepID=G5KD98_9STRE|nr:ECF transporter S component [Streptococcus urinalis]EHJ55888.1 hypothetical protein STRUR_1841 [Streptococcus urinalis 2285-97]EKS17061.1 hypothetical protein HMPREF9318_01938 [Streptococcus urinalis FB127-CNA-2]VEF32689.1 membrane protein [Streptococcus urinalis]